VLSGYREGGSFPKGVVRECVIIMESVKEMLCACRIETLGREMDGILYLSLHLASQGMPTLLGDRVVDEIVKTADCPVIYFDKDQHKPTNTAVLSKGGAVYNINAEGLGLLASGPAVLKYTRIIDHVSMICAWGDVQARLIREALSEEKISRVHSIGYPSFDLADEKFKPYYRDPKIVQKHGEGYILINTNFAPGNHAMGFERYMAMISKVEEWKELYTSPEFIEKCTRQAHYQQKLATEFCRLGVVLAERYPDRHVILRPHPTENMATYTQGPRPSNFFVESSGAVRDWIASSGLVIHHDCTSAVEAALMGLPVVHYRPVFDQASVNSLMADFGLKASRPSDVFEAIEGKLYSKEEVLETIAPYLTNTRQSACRELAKYAARFSGGTPAWIPKPLGVIGQLREWRKYLSKVLRAKQPGVNGTKVSYILNKFPRTPVEVVRKKVERLRELEGTFPEVSVISLALNTYLIVPR